MRIRPTRLPTNLNLLSVFARANALTARLRVGGARAPGRSSRLATVFARANALTARLRVGAARAPRRSSRLAAVFVRAPGRSSRPFQRIQITAWRQIMPALLGASLGSLFLSTASVAQPVFENLSASLGIDHQYTGGWEFFVGGGLASFDCDGDSFPELFVAGGENEAILLRNTTGARGNGINLQENTPDSLKISGMIGAYPLDVDSDGFLDLMVLRVGENQLLKGGANCSFAPFPVSLGFEGGDSWSTAFSAIWEQDNILPTLAVGNYIDRKDPDGPFEACDDNKLMRPDGAVYPPAQALSPGFCALSVLFSDWGRNGRADLRVSNDRHYYVKGGSEQMWAMEPSVRLYGVADSWKNQMIWGMGIASRDISGDGVPEIFLSSMGDQIMQSLDLTAGGPRFDNAPYERGTTAQRPYFGDDTRPSTGWQVELGDVQNDGRDDIFISKGNVEAMEMSAMSDPNNLLVQGVGGNFIEMGESAGIGTMERSRGAALVDLNLDGKLDLVVVNRNAAMEIYQNKTEKSGNWLLLDLKQTENNVNGVGAWIEINGSEKNWSRENTVGGGHASGSATLKHFGLGDAQSVRLRVIWPDGVASQWRDVATNQILTLHRTENGLVIEEI